MSGWSVESYIRPTQPASCWIAPQSLAANVHDDFSGLLCYHLWGHLCVSSLLILMVLSRRMSHKYLLMDLRVPAALWITRITRTEHMYLLSLWTSNLFWPLRKRQFSIRGFVKSRHQQLFKLVLAFLFVEWCHSYVVDICDGYLCCKYTSNPHCAFL